MISVLRMEMWISKFKNFLDLTCADCGEDLEGEWSESIAEMNETIRIKPCNTCMDTVAVEAIKELREEEETEEGGLHQESTDQ